MVYRVEKIEKHPYEDIYTIVFSKNGTKISAEIPSILFEELDVDPEKISEAEVLVSGEKPDLEPWDIVMRATVFEVRKEEEKEVIYASAGGLQIRVQNPESSTLAEKEKIYIAFKLKTRKA